MELKKVTLVYFSATDTTRKTLRAIARGMGAPVEEVDFTLPGDRVEPHAFGPDDFILFGAPVYGGLMPLFEREYLQKITGKNTPCAVVGVYGNREFEDALVEMEDLVSANGFAVIGGGAFIGEHSFSSEIAGGRPDENDLAVAENFGKKLAEKVAAMTEIAPLPQGILPGNRPYKERGGAGAPMTPETNDDCVNCKLCARKCPMGAIDLEDVHKVDPDKCIHCLRCVRVCPKKAKAFTSEAFKGTVAWCLANFAEPRKEPVTFL